MSTQDYMNYDRSFRRTVDLMTSPLRRRPEAQVGTERPEAQSTPEETAAAALREMESERHRRAHGAMVAERSRELARLEAERVASTPDRWLPGAPDRAPTAEPLPVALQGHGETIGRTERMLKALGMAPTPKPHAWSVDPEAASLVGLRLAGASSTRVEAIERGREEASRFPHLAVGLSLADRAGMGLNTFESLPGLRRLSVEGGGRGEGASGNPAFAGNPYDFGWSVVARAAAVETKAWIDDGTQHGLGQALDRAVRGAAADRLAWRGARTDVLLADQLDAQAEFATRRVEAFLSNGGQVEMRMPQVAEAVVKSGNLDRRFAHLGEAAGPRPEGDQARWVEQALRTERAMAQAGVLPARDVARLAIRGEYAALEGVERMGMKRAHPDFTVGESRNPQRTREAMDRAFSSMREAVVPRRTPEIDVETRETAPIRSVAAAAAMRADRSR